MIISGAIQYKLPLIELHMSDYDADNMGRLSMYLAAPKSDNLTFDFPSNKMLAPLRSA